MKKKLFSAILALACAICCTFSLVACNGNDTPEREPTALEKAYANYRITENMTVTVSDQRIEKFGTDYSATVKIDYAHKAAYVKNYFFTTDNLSQTYKFAFEHYYEIDSDVPSFTIYDSFYDLEEDDAQSVWNIIDRSDLFNTPETVDDRQKFEIQLFTNFVNSYLPSHAPTDTGWRINENDETHWASLELFASMDVFSKSANGYKADLYLCINPGDGTFMPYACTVTIKLDAQDRFESVVIDFGANGKITSEFTYGATTVTIPEAAKNARN